MFPRSKPNLQSALWAAALIVLITSGCSTLPRINSQFDTTLGSKHKTSNVYQKEGISRKLDRVALLPFYKGSYQHYDMKIVEENFRLELVKRNLFEVVAIDSDTMFEMFPKARYSSVEYLPTDLLTKLHTRYAIDGLMLVDVSYYSAYQPVGLGVKAKLLDGKTGELIWAADEVFDSSNPGVSNSARKFYKTESSLQFPLHNTQSVLHSPNRFSKYVANSIFGAIYLKKD